MLTENNRRNLQILAFVVHPHAHISACSHTCFRTQEHTCELYPPISTEKIKRSILESERVNSQENTFQSKTTKY